MLTPFLPVLIALGPMFLAIAVLYLLQRREKQKNKRSPLSGMLLRSPGESLHAQIDEVREKLTEHLMMLALMPSVLLSYYLLSSRTLTNSQNMISFYFFVLLGVAIITHYIVKIVKLVKKNDRLKLGLACELAVGQELNQLMRKGCYVFHDYLAENFNIDHIVVGPAGVFAVETKGRSKQIPQKGNVNAKVVYDGKILSFPGGIETKEPLEQADRQAKYLAKVLSKAVGENVKVQPVVALPGWFIDTKERSPKVSVITPMNEGFLNQLAIPANGNGLPKQLIDRIAYQLEQHCRDIKIIDKD